MNRRHFLATTTLLGRIYSATSSAVPVKRSLALGLPKNERIQHLLNIENNFYYISYNTITRTSTLGFSTPDGRTQWHWPLPLHAFYSTLGRLPSGSFLLPTMNRGTGREIREFSSDGKLVRTVPVPEVAGGASGFCLVGQTVVGLQRVYSVELINITGPVPRVSYVNEVFAGCDFPSLLPVSNSKVLIIDQEKARFVIFDTATGSQGIHLIQNAEVSSSLDYYAQKEWVQQPGMARSAPVVILGGAIDSAGYLYFLLSPIDRKRGAVIVKSDQNGTTQTIVACQIPDRAVKRSIPNNLAVIGGELFLIYLDGDVLVYLI